MKISRLIPMAVIVALLAVVTSSCIEKEPLNTECDIETVTLPDDDLMRSPNITNTSVELLVKKNVEVDALAPEFTLTPGATIVPASGTVRDFTTPQEYTVTSQDGQWNKTYTVTVKRSNAINLKYNFEYTQLVESSGKGHYEEFIEYEDDDPEIPDDEKVINMVWASGNQGFALTNGNKGPETYPTFQTADGYAGKCAELITRSTGAFGAMVGMPLAAGNLFIGNFNITNAVNKPLEATQFGTSFTSVPTHFRGYYKYAPGEKFMQLEGRKLVEVPGRTDECDIYAVFYESTEEMEYLDGNNVLSESNPNIIAIARMDQQQRLGAADWTYFDLPFVYRIGKEIDLDKLEAGVYSLAVVMTSSIEGAKFSGAVGSTLYVDELEIICPEFDK